MANEVINETEESAQAETPVSEETNTNNSVETSPEETPAATQQETATTEQPAPVIADEQTIPAEQPATESQPTTEEDFGKILEKFEQEQTVYHTGDLVEGKVVGVSDRGVLIDFGYKSEGIAPIEDFTSQEGEVTVQKDDAVEVIIRSISSGDAPPMLSRIDAVTRKSWDEIEKAFNEEKPITGRVVEVTKGGLRIDINGVEAFLPGSQVDSRPIRNLNSYLNKDIEAQIIKFSRKRNNIVLSRKVLVDEVVNKLKNETLSQIAEGYVIEGTVKNLTEYGAFVDIGGLDGLLHVTDMSWGRLQNPADLFKVNDHIQVKVLKLDRDKGKVALGYKQLIPDPWSTVMELYQVGAKIKGKVSSVTEYGAFVELEPGVEGLVHVSEMSWSKRSASPKKLVNSGDEVEVQVLGIDTDDRRISLGMKQLQPNPWQTVHERYRVGQTVKGSVRNLTEFGAFVEVEDGIDGLVHVSDITWSKKVKHPKDVLKRDQEVEAVIKSIDTTNRRMSLSIKDLSPSAWETFITTHKVGDVVRGKVSRFTGFGVFVELGNELEGLCHISELSDERVNRAEDVVSVGQEMDFKILRIENGDQKIALSARAVGKEDEPVIDTKSYSTEAKGGMASLGELMNLKRGGATEEEAKEEQPRVSKKERKALQAQEKAEQEKLAAEKAEADAKAAEEAEASSAQSATAETETAAEAVSSDEQSDAITSEADAEPAADKPAEDAPAAEQTGEETSAETREDPSTVEESSENPVETSETETTANVETDHTGEAESETPTTAETETSPVADADEDRKANGETSAAAADSAPTELAQNSETADDAETVKASDEPKDGAEAVKASDEPKDATETVKASEDSEEKTANG